MAFFPFPKIIKISIQKYKIERNDQSEYLPVLLCRALTVLSVYTAVFTYDLHCVFLWEKHSGGRLSARGKLEGRLADSLLGNKL